MTLRSQFCYPLSAFHRRNRLEVLPDSARLVFGQFDVQ